MLDVRRVNVVHPLHYITEHLRKYATAVDHEFTLLPKTKTRIFLPQNVSNFQTGTTLNSLARYFPVPSFSQI